MLQSNLFPGGQGRGWPGISENISSNEAGRIEASLENDF